MLTPEELKQVEDYIFEKLPQVLEIDRRFAVLIEGILAEKFPRRDEFNRLLEELTQLRIEQSARFEQVNQRFEQVNQQFERVNQRFEQVDQRFDRLEARMDGIDARMDRTDNRLEAIVEGLRRNNDKLDLGLAAVSNLQSRVGRNLEDTFAGALRYALNRRDISPENIQLRKSFVDTHGEIGPPGRDYEIDILIDNSTVIVFEVKSNCNTRDLLHFNDKAEFIRKWDYLNKVVEKVMITLEKNPFLLSKCQELGITLV
ncbi:hypothetical protein HYR99_28645 [Candidatus Poribacteria bacterium]|nr:hypothetical protein [Candidatus Poribacteria bacterium]